MTIDYEYSSTKDLIRRDMPKKVLNYIKKDLIRLLNPKFKELQQGSDDDRKKVHYADICDIFEKIEEDLETPQINGNMFRITVPQEMGVPAMLYWKLRSDSKPLGLKDFIIPIGPGLSSFFETGNFYMDLEGNVKEYEGDEHFLPLPIFNGIFVEKEDMYKLQRIRPTKTKERYLHILSYIQAYTRNATEVKAVEPGLYKTTDICYVGEYGYIKDTAARFDELQLIMKTGIYRGDSITLKDERVITLTDRVQPMMKVDERFVTKEGLTLNELQEGEFNRGEVYDRLHGVYEIADTPEEEFAKRFRLGEFDGFHYGSGADAFIAIRKGEIHSIEGEGRKVGVRFLNVCGFEEWYNGLLNP